MALYRLGLYEKSMPGTLTLREKLEETKKAGFDYMELSVDETDEKLARLEWKDEDIKYLTDAMREVGTPIHSICLSGHRKYPLGHPDASVRERSLEIMEKTLILANRIGVRIIQLAGYDVYYEEGTAETRRLFEKNLEKAALMAAKYGVVIAFETMETPFMNTVAKAMEQVHRVNSPWLQVYPDVGNLTNAAVAAQDSVERDLAVGRGHISAVHLKETEPGVYREVPYGTGHVDFVSAAAMALELGVRTFVGEFWYTGSETWRQDLADANVFLRDKLEKAKKAVPGLAE